MILTEALVSLALPLALPQTWPSSHMLALPVEVYGPYIIPSDPLADAGSSNLGTGQVRAKLEDTVRLEGPRDLLETRANFARATAAELMGYQGLVENWDGEGASAPSLDEIGNALRMLAATPYQLGPPKPMVLASGEVAIYWDHGDTYAEIGFDDSGNYYAYATRPGFEPVHLDDIPVEDQEGRTVFPAAVLEILTAESLKTAA